MVVVSTIQVVDYHLMRMKQILDLIFILLDAMSVFFDQGIYFWFLASSSVFYANPYWKVITFLHLDVSFLVGGLYFKFVANLVGLSITAVWRCPFPLIYSWETTSLKLKYFFFLAFPFLISTLYLPSLWGLLTFGQLLIPDHLFVVRPDQAALTKGAYFSLQKAIWLCCQNNYQHALCWGPFDFEY